MPTKIRPDDRLIIDSVNGVQLPRGTTAERPASSVPGTIRFNTSIGELEVRKEEISLGSGWYSLLRAGESVVSIDAGQSGERPAAGREGSLWVDLTDNRTYYDNGTQWVSVSSSQSLDPIAILSSGNMGSIIDTGSTDAFGATIELAQLDLADSGPLTNVELGNVA